MFKSPHQVEFNAIVQYLDEELKGSQIQDVQTHDHGLVLSIYRFHKMPQVVYLVIYLDTPFPFLALYNKHPWPKLKKSTPVGLFLKSHFIHAKFEAIYCEENMGRVAQFKFNLPGYVWQCVMIPKQPNFTAIITAKKSQLKKISWEKPKELLPQNADFVPNDDVDVRSIPFMFQQWWKLHAKTDNFHIQKNSSEIDYDSWVKNRLKLATKKKEALDKVKQQAELQSSNVYSELGEHLKSYGFMDVKPEWMPLIRQDLSLSENIDYVFNKAKTNKEKIKGTVLRYEKLEEELIHLENTDMNVFQDELKRLSERKIIQSQRKKIDGEFRKLVLNEDKGLTCLLGKSALDNLKLLRQAKSWDLWIHLKDYPSAHAIIVKNRDQKVSDEDIHKASVWLINQHIKDQSAKMGLKFAVVIVECRHVRPIKGDRIGRVTYHHPREILITV